jgi:hypothetical protein
MQGVVIYGVGSAVVVDVEESLERAGLPVLAAVRNVPGEAYLLDQRTLVELSDLSAGLTAHPFVVPMFVPGNRQKAAHEATSRGFLHPYSLVDPSVASPRSLEFGHGLYVNTGCSLGAAGRFEAFVFINRGANVGHHVQLGAFASVGPGAVIAGMARIGKGAVIGAGAVVLPKIRIGDNAVVAAGSVVTKDVPAHCLVMGSPATIVRDGIPGYSNMSVS